MEIADAIHERIEAEELAALEEESGEPETEPDEDAISPAMRLIAAAQAGLKALEEELPDGRFIVIGLGPENWTAIHSQTMGAKGVAKTLNMVLTEALQRT